MYDVKLNAKANCLEIYTDKEAFIMNWRGSIQRSVKKYHNHFNPDHYYEDMIKSGFGWLEAIQKTVIRTEELDKLEKDAPKLSFN